MSIFGIGTDIVSVDRMRANLDKWGDRFAERMLSATELAEFRDTTRQAHFLAKRFAAKEAAAKALGTGFRDGISLTHISVGHTAAGQPLLNFSDRAHDVVVEQGIQHSHLSIADERDHAVAFVVLTR